MESGSSSDSSKPPSKKVKQQRMWEEWLDDYRNHQSDRLDDPSLPKLEKPYTHWLKYKVEEKAAREGASSSGATATGKLLKQVKKTPSPPTAKFQDRLLPAQDVDNHVAMPPLTGPLLRHCRILSQPPIPASTVLLRMGRTPISSQARSFSRNALSSESESARGAATTVRSVVNLVSSQSYQGQQEMTEMHQHRCT